MWSWIKKNWKLLTLALGSLTGVIGYLWLKSRGLEKEAAKLRAQNAVKAAEVKVAYLEEQKKKNKTRINRIPAEEAELDKRLKAERARLKEANKQVKSLSDQEVLKEFKKLGY